ncbi:MAG TPA: thermostable hemolysin [Candidatus Paceibacterota bacterium]
MFRIGTAYPHEDMYRAASQFAKEVYGQRLHAMIAGTPDVFAYARYGTSLVGCVGLYHADASRQVLLETYAPDALSTISGSPNTDRRLLGELGTRAVRLPDDIRERNADISLAITATVVSIAYLSNIRYLVLTSNRTASLIAQELGIELIRLCEPDISHLDKEFQDNWKEYFRVKQYCFGCALTTPAGCRRTLAHLEMKGIFSENDDLRHAA